jgi:hypothetical protein
MRLLDMLLLVLLRLVMVVQTGVMWGVVLQLLPARHRRRCVPIPCLVMPPPPAANEARGAVQLRAAALKGAHHALHDL